MKSHTLHTYTQNKTNIVTEYKRKSSSKVFIEMSSIFYRMVAYL